MKLTLIYIIIWCPLIFFALADYIQGNGYVENQLTLYIIVISVFFFCLGSIFYSYIDSKCNITCNRHELSFSNKSRALYILYCLIFLCFLGFINSILVWSALGIDLLNFNFGMLYEMNVIYSEEKRVLTGIGGRLYALNYIAILYVCYLLYNKLLSLKYAIFIISLLIVFLISPRRVIILYSIISIIIFSFFLFYKVNKYKFVLTFSCASVTLILLFGFTQFKLGKIQNFDVVSSLQVFFEYAMGSVRVMDALLYTKHFEQTWILFSTPIRFIDSLFDFKPVVDLSIPFVYVPDYNNTLPSPYYLYKSGGMQMVILISTIQGFITNIFFMSFRQNSSFLCFSFTIMLCLNMLLSIRELTFITYDFMFWSFCAILINLILKYKSSFRSSNET